MKTLWDAAKIFLLLTLLTGVVYPLAVTAAARLLFPAQAAGSLASRGGQPVGSLLIAQKFSAPRYFWPRPSAVDYNPLPSGASNLGPTSASLQKQLAERTAFWNRSAGRPENEMVPADLLFASGSGLDPDLTPKAALFQLERVAAARGFDAARREQLKILISRLTAPRTFQLLGEPRVNVLQLNLELDRLEENGR